MGKKESKAVGTAAADNGVGEDDGRWKYEEVAPKKDPSGGADAVDDAIELGERRGADDDGAPGKMGLGALLHESRHAAGGAADGSTVFWKVYKRRWFGVVQLTLLNAVVSWDWLTFSPVPAHAAAYFGNSESAINWLSIAFLLAFPVASPAVMYVLHMGPKPSIVVSAVLVLLGNWLRYAGVRAGDGSGNFGLVMFGQILTGLAQPFVLAAPTRYSDLWFTSSGRVAVTALMSLANPLGAALGQLIVPFMVMGPADIPNMVLYVAIISSVCALPAFFIPAAPPTPAAPSGETRKADILESLRLLIVSPEFWMLFIPFAFYVGFFNSISSLLNQIMVPYGYSNDEAGIAGAVLIVVGLVAAAATSPIIDRTKAFILTIKILIPVIAVSYLAFIWMPGTREGGGLAGPYVVLAVLGACFIVISDALKEGPDGSPPLNMTRALVFQAVLAIAAAAPPLCIGLFGRQDKIHLRRVASEQMALARAGQGVA
ncbi:hypothetical protein RB595_002573 [Gaeumannomyces hyphopodioides]